MLEIGVAERPKIGATVSGDCYVIADNDTSTLIAVIDGLGGGHAAALAAGNARAAIQETTQQPLRNMLQAAHQACMGTRGAVVGLLRLDHGQHQATYAGVGNIGVHVISRHAIKPISRQGIVGYRMPNVVEQQATYDAGDTFIIFSDGISTHMDLSQLDLSPQQLADHLMATCSKDNDDATVVVVKTMTQD